MNYRPRIGESSVTGSFWKAWRLGWRMIFLVWEYRLGLVVRDRVMWSDCPPAAEPEMARPLAADAGLQALETALHGRIEQPESAPVQGLD